MILTTKIHAKWWRKDLSVRGTRTSSTKDGYQKDYLLTLFTAARTSKKKPDPKVVANDMKTLKSNGVLRFGPNEWLNYRQDASYFSREAARVKSGQQENVPVTVANDEEMHEDGDIELDLEDDPIFPSQFELDRELIQNEFAGKPEESHVTQRNRGHSGEKSFF